METLIQHFDALPPVLKAVVVLVMIVTTALFFRIP